MGIVFQDPAAAAAAANTMEGAISDIRGTLKRITDAVESVGGGWQGTAANAFYDAAFAWHEESVRLNQKLDAVHQNVEDGQKQYSLADTDNADDYKGPTANSNYVHLNPGNKA
ncbi:WXG100 family type VII secretion target [Nocardia caishijiensis]|uniref:WXG100 family type VII secretion target n=1 Tax=Nocardia caishijiensis TaxID=184756 RepID=A0ABQ6YRF0_9NOCA|nr:WXG100 family type VII secretion target [Nocardia caishijiensis]KAF0848286.1 WXG100 family type VII secretion target [Nocardia caishijiensis]